MEDEPVTIWDTFEKKTRMNSLRTGAQKDLLDFELGPLSGLELYRARTFTGLRTSSEPEALSGLELWELYADDSSPDWDYLQMNSRMEAGLKLSFFFCLTLPTFVSAGCALSRTVNITVVCVVHGNFVFTSRTYCHDHSGHICNPDRPTSN